MGEYSRELQKTLEKNIGRVGFVAPRDATDEIFSQSEENYKLFAKRILVDFCGITEKRFEKTFLEEPQAIEQFKRCLTHVSFDPKNNWKVYSLLGTESLKCAIVNWLCTTTDILQVPRGDFFITEIMQHISDKDYFSAIGKFLGLDKMIRWQAIRVKPSGADNRFVRLQLGEIMIDDSLKSLCFWVERFLTTTFGKDAAAVGVANAATQNIVAICAKHVMGNLSVQKIDAKFLSSIKNPITKVKEILKDRLRLSNPQYVNTQTEKGFTVSITLPRIGKCPQKGFASREVARPKDGEEDVAEQALKWLETCGQTYSPSLIQIDMKNIDPVSYSPEHDEENSHLAFFGNLLVMAGLPRPEVIATIAKNRSLIALEIKRALTHETTLESVESPVPGSFNYQTYELLGDYVSNKVLGTYIYNKFKMGEDQGAPQKIDLVKSRIQSKSFTSQHLHYQLGITDKTSGKTLIRWQPLTQYERVRLSDGSFSNKNDPATKRWQWSLSNNPDKTNMLEDTWETVFGVLSFLGDKIFYKGVGFGLCYNLMSAILDKIPISVELEENATFVTKLKEWLDKVHGASVPRWNDVQRTITFGIENDPLHWNDMATFKANYNQTFDKVFIVAELHSMGETVNVGRFDPGPVLQEMKARWYNKLPGEKFNPNGLDETREMISGVVYKWLASTYRWNVEKSALELIGG